MASCLRASLFCFLFSAFCLFLPGCLAPQPQSAVLRIDPWDSQHPQSRCIVTPHYRIYTDLRDSDDMRSIATIMESAYAQYQRTFPAASDGVPLRCFLFSRRDEWAAFTARNAGQDAAVYLKINRGAYTIDDWFVAFWLGDRGTFAVMAHEGWHQYVARHLKGRIAPAIEEGFACQFENLEFDGKTPTWHASRSVARSNSIAEALAENRLWPVREILRMHAGDIVRLRRPQIETFYAQNWALSLFLMEKYPSQMQQYLSDVAKGTAWRPATFSSLKPSEWNPNLSGPQLEHYLHTPIASLEQPFFRYCLALARESP